MLPRSPAPPASPRRPPTTVLSSCRTRADFGGFDELVTEALERRRHARGRFPNGRPAKCTNSESCVVRDSSAVSERNHSQEQAALS